MHVFYHQQNMLTVNLHNQFYKLSTKISSGRSFMDLRIQRTKRCITEAFLKLRTQKPLEKITIKELSELAMINKATFYSHYTDIYDLSEQ